MKNSSLTSKPHECQDSWSAIFCGLVQILITSNQPQQLKLLIPPAQILAPIRVNRAVELLQQMMRNPNIDLFYTLINQEEATYLMKMFVSTSWRDIPPPVCNKEILQKISNTFKVDTIFLTYNTSISLSNSENVPYVLKVVQFQNKYTVEILDKQQPTLGQSRSRSNSIQHDYILEMKQECNGCLRQFEQLDLNRSITCSHTYCKQCLKLYFKLGSFFICRDFFCKRELCRDDFPFLQLSPLMEFAEKIDKCLQCKQSSSRLFTNKCGHTHCENCIRQSLGRAQYFQTHFCLEPACTEIMDNEIVHNNKPQINVSSILQRSNSINKKAADFCQFCQKIQDQVVRNKCNHYYCKQCLQDQYQRVISFGLSKMIECPSCSVLFNVDTLLEEYYLQLQQLSTPRQVRSISQQQPDILLTPSQTTIRETITTTSTRQKTNENDQSSRRQNSMDFNSKGDSTPRRALPQTYGSTRGPTSVSQTFTKTTYTFSRNPQFF